MSASQTPEIHLQGNIGFNFHIILKTSSKSSFGNFLRTSPQNSLARCLLQVLRSVLLPSFTAPKKLVQQGTSTFHRKQKISRSDRYLCFVLTVVVTVATCNLKMCNLAMPSGYIPQTLFHLFIQPALGMSSPAYPKCYPAPQHCSVQQYNA